MEEETPGDIMRDNMSDKHPKSTKSKKSKSSKA